MADELRFSLLTSREERYQELFPQIEALVAAETDLIANLANIAAALKTAMEFLWVGFYLVKDEELILGPFQGPIACTRIQKGKGVCGKAWQLKDSLIVPNVDDFPGHILCSSASKSEIVIPMLTNNEVVGVLDIDSSVLDDFDEVDEKYLKEILVMLEETGNNSSGN